MTIERPETFTCLYYGTFGSVMVPNRLVSSHRLLVPPSRFIAIVSSSMSFTSLILPTRLHPILHPFPLIHAFKGLLDLILPIAPRNDAPF